MDLFLFKTSLFSFLRTFMAVIPFFPLLCQARFITTRKFITSSVYLVTASFCDSASCYFLGNLPLVVGLQCSLALSVSSAELAS